MSEVRRTDDGGVDGLRSTHDLYRDPTALRRGQYRSTTNLDRRTALYESLTSELPAWYDYEDWVLADVDRNRTGVVIDVGCGPAALLGRFDGPGARIGIDLSEGMLRRARVHASAVACADVMALPLVDASVDVVLAAHMLYHVADVASGLEELHRVLRPGGILVATTNAMDDKHELTDAWADAWEEVTGSRAVPRLQQAFPLEDAAAAIAERFTVTSERHLHGKFRFTDPDLPLQRLDTFREDVTPGLPTETWQAAMDIVRRRIETAIADRGAFIMTKHSGVVTATRPV